MWPWAQKWGWVLKIIILHFSPAMLPGCPPGVHHSLKPSPNVPGYPYMGHVLSSFYAFAQYGMPLYPLCIWWSLRFSSNVASSVIPSMNLLGKTDHAFIVYPNLLLPHIYPLYSVHTFKCNHHLFIYRSISLTKLQTCWRQRPSFNFVSQAQCLVQSLWMDIQMNVSTYR